MNRPLTLPVRACVAVVAIAATSIGAPPDENWGQWRGPLANGVAPKATPPTKWSESSNVRWRIDLPGDGHSTPIIWGDRVFIQVAIPDGPIEPKAAQPAEPAKGGPPTPPATGAKGHGFSISQAMQAEPPPPPSGGARDRGPGRGGPPEIRTVAPSDPHQFVIISYDRKTGKETWRHVCRKEVPHEGRHEDGSLAPASPLTDGTHLFAYFGSRGLYCFDMNGKLLWEKDLGDMRTRAGFGEGASPVLYKDWLVIAWDHEGDSFIVALDKNTGEEKWRRPREEVTTWATPLVIEVEGRAQVIVPATKRIRSYDLLTGDIVWECGGLGLNAIPSPVASRDLVIAMTGFREPQALAIRVPGAKGDLTDSPAVVWRTDKGTSYVPSPLLYGDCLYFLQKNSEILSCVDPQTGKPHFGQTRLEEIDGVYSSPLGADGRVYVLGRNGTTYVLERGSTFKTLAVNKLDDDFSASPAAAGKELFLRGRKHLYCIAE